MEVAIRIDEEHTAVLNAEAERLGVSPEVAAKTVLLEALNRKAKFAAVAERVISKNAELYKRLS